MWGVTGLAQEGRPALQQASGGRTVGVVANRAVFVNRLMVAHEGPTFFHMAGVAGFHHAIALHKAGASGSVRIVAIGARNFAFRNGMSRRLVELDSLLLVASKANLGFRFFIEHLVFRNVNQVARRASHVSGLVDTPLPMRTLGIIFVTSQAGFALVLMRSRRLLSKSGVRLGWLVFALVFDVFVTLAMTTGTGGGAAVCLDAVTRFANGKEFRRVCLIVTLGAPSIILEEQIFGRSRLG